MLEKDGEDKLDGQREELRSPTYREGRNKYPTYNKKEGQLHWSRLAQELPFKTCYSWKDRGKYRSEDDDGDVSSYWKTLRNKENTESRKRKHQIALGGEFTLEKATKLSTDRVMNLKTAG